MLLKDYEFQDDAVNRLLDAYFSKNDNIILQAPTGAGKTIIFIKLMDQLYQELGAINNIAFVWLTPGTGDLEKQSYNKTAQFAKKVEPQFLYQALELGFNTGTVTFLNWELVSKKRNIALKDGERTNLDKAIAKAKSKGITFVLIIDEEHRNQTKKAQNIVDKFDASKIYRASATPIEDKSAKTIDISEDSVISAGLITREVVINDQLSQDNQYGDDEEFLDAANDKRIAIKQAYAKLDKDINPLVLIQFPDEKKLDDEINNKVENVKAYLTQELDIDDKDIAIWLSDKHENTENISRNNSNIKYLFMKQAVSTGWDAPRAKILVKLRLNTSARFTIQTIGRIRRMPEQRHYNNSLLDDSFVYSNDEQYVLDIINNNAGGKLTQMSLKPDVSPDIFNLTMLKRKSFMHKNLRDVTRKLRHEFEKEFDLNKKYQSERNKKQLEKYGWHFGAEVLYDIPYGEVEKLSDFASLAKKTVVQPIIQTRQYGYRYDAAISLLIPYLHVGHNLGDIRAVIADLFDYNQSGSEVEPILKLNPRERFGFVINNAKKLRDVAKRMDADDRFVVMTLAEATDSYKFNHINYRVRERDGYLDDDTKKPLLKKNIYTGYTESNWLKQSKGEKMFESQAEKIPQIKWIYRSKDHGEEYFSIPYDNDTRDFYPDYLVKTQDGQTYIIEIKGKDNIDDYAASKFESLKHYVNTELAHGAKFAFVRQSALHPDVLVYSNTKWTDDPDSSEWHPLEELF